MALFQFFLRTAFSRLRNMEMLLSTVYDINELQMYGNSLTMIRGNSKIRDQSADQLSLTKS